MVFEQYTDCLAFRHGEKTTWRVKVTIIATSLRTLGELYLEHCRSLKTSMDIVPVGVVKGLLARGQTYNQISAYLKQQYPHVPRGFSERSIRRFVKENDLKEEVKSEAVEVVQEAVSEVTVTININFCQYSML